MPATGPSRPLPITDPDRLRAALEGYGDRERRVLELRYGLSGERQHSLSEVGRLMGLSGERVRQLEARVLDRLSRQERGLPLDPVVHRSPSRRVAAGGGSSSRRRFLRPWTLALIRLEPTHGSRLKDRLRELGMPEADYRFLRGLEEEGLLRSTWVPGGGVGPDRRVYRLTDKGLAELEQSLPALRGVAEMLDKLLPETSGSQEPGSQEPGSQEPGASGAREPGAAAAAGDGSEAEDVRQARLTGMTAFKSSSPEEGIP